MPTHHVVRRARYFPNQGLLVAAAHPEIERESLLPSDAPTDPIARAHLVIDGAVRIVLEWEPQLRASLRLSLEPAADPLRPVLRRGRVIGWLLDALHPLESTRPDLDVRRIAVAVRTATGIEAFLWLVDVAGCSRDEAAEVLRANGRAILRAHLGQGSAPAEPGGRGAAG